MAMLFHIAALFSSALEDRAKVVWDRHGTHRIDVGPAGISWGNPDSREKSGSNDAARLAEDLARASCKDAVFEHKPMDVNVADSLALTEDVGALQVVKRICVLASPRVLAGAEDFGVNCIIQGVTHCLAGPNCGCVS